MSDLKSNFAVVNKHSAFYSGGCVQVSADGCHVFCQYKNGVNVVCYSTGAVVRLLHHDDDLELTYFLLSPDDTILVTASSNLILRHWDWTNGVVLRAWKAIHTAPVSSMAFDSTSTLLATGGADATVKVWDVVRQYCTNNLRQHQGVVSLVQFHLDSSRLLLFAADDEYSIRVWKLESSSCVAVLRGHYSAVTAMQFTLDGSLLYSGSRDRSVIVWDVESFARKNTIAINKCVESLILLPTDRDNSSESRHFIVVTDTGVLNVWNLSGLVYSSQSDGPSENRSADAATDSPQVVTSAFYCQALDAVCVTTHEQNIVFYSRDGLKQFKQLVGHYDEVLDVRFWGRDDSQVAVATNSSLLKIFDCSSWACRTVSGHTDCVVAIDTFHKGNNFLLASGAKDNVVRVWTMDSENCNVTCTAAGYGHTHTVMSVAFFRLTSSYLVSGSRDLTIKLWSLPQTEPSQGTVLPLLAKLTQKAHDKEIQSLAVSPNDKLIASGSRDKKAKVWNVADLSLVGVCSGHSGGIWCVHFSPVDQCLATASADGTVKMWALSDFSCVRTFQGHSSAVLKLRFLVRGMQIVSCDSGGLMKLWNVKNSECVKSLEVSDDDATVWALAVNTKEDHIITGTSDSTLILWKDITEEEWKTQHEKKQAQILQEQELSNLLMEKNYLKAIALAITLEQPLRVLNITKEILDGESGEKDLKAALDQLRDDQINTLLRFAQKWITNGRHSYATLFILQSVFQRYTPEQLDSLPDFRKSIEGLMMYTERHHERHRRLVERVQFVSYTLQCMHNLDSGSQSVRSGSVLQQ